MELTSNSANIFVFGDLVLDHFIPVEEKRKPFQSVGLERVFDGQPHRTIAGGAANSARLLAALSHGRTCLWGLSGHSPLGTFVQVLKRSEAQLGAGRGVIFHGGYNESHEMNTITRIVSTDRKGFHHREFRIDDVNFIPVTDSQRRDAVEYLKAEMDEHGVDAIIVNDLDMKGVSEQLIVDIAELADANGIPLFVDPKRDWRKYHHTHVTCALPNLTEWCHIINDPNSEERWRDDLVAGRSLERMAVLSLRYMGNAECHIIKCDKDGIVLISPAGRDQRRIYHILPHATTRSTLLDQLGAGDIFVAALALEYTSTHSEPDMNKRMLKALSKANAVVACYLEMDWQQVPTNRELCQFKLLDPRIEKTTEITNSVLLLPPFDHTDIDLRNYSVLGSNLVSLDSVYTSTVKEMIDFLVHGWRDSNLRSAILTGRGGVGKSDLLELLQLKLGESKIDVWSDPGFSKKKYPDVETTLELIKKRRLRRKHDLEGQLIVIDEAFVKAGHLLLGEAGKMLMQESSRLNPKTRFLFIDADYSRHHAEVSKSQFLSRCKVFDLPSLDSRHCDIPYIFAAGCIKGLRKKGIESVRISESVLLGVTNWVLQTPEEDQSPRVLVEKAIDIASAALRKQTDAVGAPEISRRHLPADLQKLVGERLGPKRFIRFSWPTNQSNQSFQPTTRRRTTVRC
jgi:sugar/nucleoside kinase (ribokinase family)